MSGLIEADERAPSRCRAIAYRTIACLLPLLLAGVALEVVLRHRYSSISQITGAAEWKVTEWGGISYEWDRYDGQLGWVNAPGYRSGPAVPFQVTINDQGLRAVRNYDPKPPPGVTRIAVFGDSCIFGEEVDDGDTVPAHLERLLPSTEVLNFGVHGYGLGQMAMLYEMRAREFSPAHVVVVLLVPDDLARDTFDFFGHPKPLFVREADGRVLVRNVPVPEATRQPWIFRHVYSAAWLFGRAKPLEVKPNFGDQVAISLALVRQMKEWCDRDGAGLTVVPVTVAGSIERMKKDEQYRQATVLMQAALRDSGVEILDLIDPLTRAYASEGRDLAAPVAHWSSRGNCLIAERIAGALAPKLGKTVRSGGCRDVR